MATRAADIERRILSARELAAAWKWLRRTISRRPMGVVPPPCLFDRKQWRSGKAVYPLRSTTGTLNNLAKLYIASQFGTIDHLVALANGGRARAVYAPVVVDGDILGVMTTPARFRAALAEHLTFWVSLAEAVAIGGKGAKVAITEPNFQPEDKGHDGLVLSLGANDWLELYSVKNSINNPASHICSVRFRNGGKPKKRKLLDDLYRLDRKQCGIARLHRKVADVYRLLNATPTRIVKAGVIAHCRYNAVVVADDVHATEVAFKPFERITPAERCVATYVGATSWKRVASQTRKRALALIK